MTSRELSAARRRLHPLVVPGGVAVLAGTLIGYVAVIDPNEADHYPTCPFLFMTGYYCPGCGTLRMLHALGNGDFAEALGRNPLAFAMIPVLVFLWGRWTVRRARGQPMLSKLAHPAWLWSFFGIVVAYWIVRNLPFAEALAP